MVPDILNKVFRLLERGGFPMDKKKRHLQMDHNVYPMRFGIVLKENPERYAVFTVSSEGTTSGQYTKT